MLSFADSLIMKNSETMLGYVTEEIDIRLLPSEIYEYKVSVMALCAGRLPFPKLTIRSSMFDPTMLDEITLLSTPDAMFILLAVGPGCLHWHEACSSFIIIQLQHDHGEC
ncbi:unnamed protein product [Wuchereria bancrofti]|uniref:Uncharacterized protein n=1 Tax=Wuchereria bancrofti TaxID=6293 RepID=A0A3P7E418_WUCBA|nr:unnamed protein product [Wuchereria bancrofti]